MRPDIVPGALSPDYQLNDRASKRRKLSDPQGRHPMALVLSRGGPYGKTYAQTLGVED
jgi:hypothetical protein